MWKLRPTSPFCKNTTIINPKIIAQGTTANLMTAQDLATQLLANPALPSGQIYSIKVTIGGQDYFYKAAKQF